MSATQTKSSHYSGESGDTYFEKKFDGRLTIGRHFQAEYFAPFCTSDRDVLDFGCGDGTILRSVKAKSKIGVELNPACHEVINAANAKIDTPIRISTDLSEVADGSVDVTISNHCLEHVPSPLDSLKQIHRVLRPEGRLVIVVPFDDWRAKKNAKWTPDDPDHHLFTWSPLSFGNLISEAGFDVDFVELRTQAWSPKFFFIREKFGDAAFRWACWAFSVYRNSREILCVATRNAK